MTGKTSEELYGPTIRGENVATKDMFELASNCLKSIIGRDMHPACFYWVANKSVDNVRAELGEPTEILGLQPTNHPETLVYEYEKTRIYVFEQDERTFTYHHITDYPTPE